MQWSSFKGRFSFLFFSLLLLAIINPFLEGGLLLKTIFFFFVALVPLSVLYSASFNKKSFSVAVVLALLFIGTHVYLLFYKSSFAHFVDLAATLLFFGYTIFIIMSFIVKKEHVDADAIYGGISVYLIIGAIWASIYFTLEAVWPGSFSGVSTPPVLNEFIYFSYATIITLVYGDITPVSAFARSLATLEAISGAFYLAIAIARLVGLYSSGKNK